jgi:hypothetical protein
MLDCAMTATAKPGCSNPPVFPLEIALDDIQFVPGKLTTLTVVVACRPVYYSSGYGAVNQISTWQISSLPPRVEVVDLEREVNRVGVRVRVELDLAERQIFQQPAFTFYDFVVQVGAWMGIWLLGSTMLHIWIRLVKPWGKLGPNDPMRLRDAAHERFEEGRKARRHAILEKRWHSERLNDKETFEMFLERLTTQGEEGYVPEAEEEEAAEGAEPEAEEDVGGARTVEKTMVEFDEWTNKKAPAVHG